MDINNLTIGQAKELAGMFGGADVATNSPHVGKKCIIRTYASGVHFGELISQSGRQVELKDARRLWKWDASPNGISLSEVSVFGVKTSTSKICSVLPEMSLLDGLEVIPCSEAAIKSIEEAPVHKP